MQSKNSCFGKDKMDWFPKINSPMYWRLGKPQNLDIPKYVIYSISDFKKVTFNEDDDPQNGCCLGNRYIPEEILCHILSYLDAKELMRISQVCKSWHKISRSHHVWMVKYKKCYLKKPKKLPWFVYYCLFTQSFFDNNFLINNDGSGGFRNWDMNHSYPGYMIERVHSKPEQLPSNIRRCFSTYSNRNIPKCFKTQKVHLARGLFSNIILDYYKPHIYISEYASCSPRYNAVYELRAYALTTVWQRPEEHKIAHRFPADEESNWVKKELVISDYPESVRKLEFYHGSYDFNKNYVGHYGTFMTGGVVKILFDSIQPKEYDKYIVD